MCDVPLISSIIIVMSVYGQHTHSVCLFPHYSLGTRKHLIHNYLSASSCHQQLLYVQLNNNVYTISHVCHLICKSYESLDIQGPGSKEHNDCADSVPLAKIVTASNTHSTLYSTTGHQAQS